MMKAQAAIHAEKRRSVRDRIATTDPAPSTKRIVVTALIVQRTTKYQGSFFPLFTSKAAISNACQPGRPSGSVILFDNWQKPSNCMDQKGSGNQQINLFHYQMLHNL